jgi:hypothetical protein
MKIQLVKNSLLRILPVLFVLFSAVVAFSGSPGVNEKIKQAQSPYDNRMEPPIPLPVNTVKVKIAYQGGDFYAQTRKDQIERFQCSACHNNKEVMIKNAARISHADKVIVHGGSSGPLDCNTCHSKEERDFLTTSKDKKIDMDHVYTLCGECHFRQKKDWIGGAHGKPVSHWAGERVVKNCTSCHDPHSPRFKKRWPATYSPPFK